MLMESHGYFLVIEDQRLSFPNGVAVWIIYSGASPRMDENKSIFRDTWIITVSIAITLGDDSGLHSNIRKCSSSVQGS